MFSSQEWWSNTADGGGSDPGDPIGQSLRFRGAQRLTAPAADFQRPAGDFTLSMWVKHARAGNTTDSVSLLGNNDSTRGYKFGSSTNASNGDMLGSRNGSALNMFSNARFRDPSAWYHLVFQNTGETTTAFVNGQRLTNTQMTFPRVGDLVIASGNPGSMDEGFNGYMADIYMIDGQVLEPTAFGRYNSQGVWVPVKPENLTYGANGFHLDFSDPNDLGTDRSGNGNDFTATGFNTDPIGIFSNDLTVLDGGTFSAGPANAFDGNEGTQANTSVTGRLQWAPSTPITVNTQLEIRVDGNMDGVWGTNATRPSSPSGPTSWITFNDGDGNPATGVIDATNPLVLSPNGFPGASSFASLNAVRVDGVILADNTGTDYDLMADSPTQNWATLNPLDNHGGTTSFPALTAANLQDDTTAASGLTGSTIHWNNENAEYYFEFVYTGSGSQASCAPGLRTAQSGQPSSRSGANSFYYRSDGRIVNGATINAGGADLATGAAWTTGDVLGTAFNPSNNRLRFFKDGAEQCDITISPSEPLQFGVYNDGITGVVVNYGQQPFLHQPDGTVALQTQNMPTPAILDGREHFQAITGPGNGASSGTPGGGNWTPYLTSVSGFQSSNPPADAFDGSSGTYAISVSNGDWTFAPEPPIPVTSTVEVFQFNNAGQTSWNGSTLTPNGTSVTFSGSGEISASNPITATSVGTGQACFLNKIVVDGEVLVDSNILALAQQTFPNGLWWIKDRANSNQHQLVDSVRGGNLAIQIPAISPEVAYVAPTGSSVAWCWNVNGSSAINNDGAIQSEVAANKEAGFSIVAYTGTGADTTFGHGLDSAPEFAIIKVRDSGSYSTVGGDALGSGTWDKVMFLNTNEGLEPTSDAYFTGAPTSTLMNIGDSANVNGSGQNYIAYCWHSVPGYSAFGSYRGNNDPNGVFVALSFRPAFVMYKNTDVTGNWVIHDTTRDTANPTDIRLVANTDNSEATSASMQVDILSNGFKQRNQDQDLNTSHTYIYAAFAENPFNYPVTAR